MAESFLPHMNGVTGSILHILKHLERRGHEALVLAPRAAGMPHEVHGAPVEAVSSMPLPGYPDVRVGAVTAHRVAVSLTAFAPDVVHLASPFALGWRGVLAADRLDIPTVAAYQTDVAGYTERYRLPATTTFAQNHVARLHRRATLTLSPSSASDGDLARWGVDRVRRWGRGVDAERFHPGARNDSWQRTAANEVIIGYVGRLAAEKQVEDLRVLHDIPGTRLVIVGDGPQRPRLEAVLPGAVFLGHQSGEALSEALASFDIFVHPGESDTFGQTLQEAHASGVPVVATGRGGPVDLVRMGIDGWLYEPGNLVDLRMRVVDLAGDAAKRRAFGAAGRAAVEKRSWTALGDELLDHFALAQELRPVDTQLRAPRTQRPEPLAPRTQGAWKRYIALGDSLTEGLCDPGPDGGLRGWADRLAYLLSARGGLHYANFAVRSRRVRDVAGEQLDHARELKPDLVSILVGANDLVKRRVNVPALLAQLEGAVQTLREDGAEVLLVTPFLPDRRVASVLLSARFAAFASGLAAIAARTGAILLDTDLFPSLAERENWGADFVHLGSRGHRFLAYRAGEALGVPHAEALGHLDEVFHAGDDNPRAWWRLYALPWMWRRMRGRTAGDGLSAKHDNYVWLGRSSAMSEVPVA